MITNNQEYTHNKTHENYQKYTSHRPHEVQQLGKN